MKTILEMKPGETGRIYSINNEQLSTKLMEMGFLKGVTICYRFAAPLGDPVCVSVDNYEVVLRKTEAQLIEIVHE